ncbi:hypothetical protein [Chitinophaga jiangningensis]|nr:hypothetical protein [Chitinophaga jiangningensis]
MEKVKTLLPIKEFIRLLTENAIAAAAPERIVTLLPAQARYNQMSPPFYQPPAHPVLMNGSSVWSALGPVRNFTDEHFSRLTHLSANLLAYIHERNASQPFYIIGSGLKATLLHQPRELAHWYISLETLFNGKLHEAAIHLVDEAGITNLLLQFDYHLLTKEKMLARFPSVYKHGATPQDFDATMPHATFTACTEERFSVTLAPFTEAHCQGHFPEFTFVPVVFLQTSITRQIYQWLEKIHGLQPAGLLPTNVEVYAWRIVETGKPLYLQHKVVPTGRQRFKILTHVYDSPARINANLLIVTDLFI